MKTVESAAASHALLWYGFGMPPPLCLLVLCLTVLQTLLSCRYLRLLTPSARWCWDHQSQGGSGLANFAWLSAIHLGTQQALRGTCVGLMRDQVLLCQILARIMQQMVAAIVWSVGPWQTGNTHAKLQPETILQIHRQSFAVCDRLMLAMSLWLQPLSSHAAAASAYAGVLP